MDGAVGNGEWGPFQLNDLLDAGRSQPPFQSIKIRLAADKSLPKSSLGVWCQFAGMHAAASHQFKLGW